MNKCKILLNFSKQINKFNFKILKDERKCPSGHILFISERELRCNNCDRRRLKVSRRCESCDYTECLDCYRSNLKLKSNKI